MTPLEIALARTPEALKLNTYYKGYYESACEWLQVENPPAWEDLTDQQRENVRQECIRHQQEMNAFGEAIRISMKKDG